MFRGGSSVGVGPANNVSITGGTITGTNVPNVLASCGIPFVKASSGTMGNNGAVSAMTALIQTSGYTGGCFMWFPAGAVAAGVPAAASWLWVVMSSTTAGTVYNSTPSSTYPVVAGTTTAFSTTGPGAFTGDTGEIFLPSINVPILTAGARIFVQRYFNANNSAGTKLEKLHWSGSGGTDLGAVTNLTTSITQRVDIDILNAGATNVQYRRYVMQTGATGINISVGGAAVAGAINSAVATTIVPSMTCNTATDNYVMESILCQLTAP